MTAIFQLIAAIFPTERIRKNHVLQTVWRVLFYLLRPGSPFVMRTEWYRVRVHPKKGESLDRTLIRRGHYEPMETAVVLDLLEPGETLIDIGANFGHYGLAAAGKLGADGYVAAFEPDPKSFAMLEENIRLNPDLPIRAVRMALSDERTTHQLFEDVSGTGGHSLIRENVGRHVATHEVEMTTLDHWVAENLRDRRIRMIKIDVQGFENKVLRGADGTIREQRPIVLCEITPTLVENAGDEWREILRLFREQDYGMSIFIEEKGLLPVSYDGGERLLAELRPYDYRNALFHPR